MKKVIFLVTSFAIGASGFSFAGQNMQTEVAVAQSRDFNWNSSGTNETISVTSVPYGIGTNDPEYGKQIYTFNLGASRPTYSQISFINSNNVYVDWGSRYGTWTLNPFAVNFEDQNNVKINSTDDSNFDKYTTIEIYDEEYTAFLAKLRVTLDFGYTWYQENGNYYMQFLVKQYINAMNSYTSATSVTELGTAARLS